MDIFFLIGILKSSVFHVLWKTIKAINKCAELWITWPYTKERQIECACGFTSIKIMDPRQLLEHPYPISYPLHVLYL